MSMTGTTSKDNKIIARRDENEGGDKVVKRKQQQRKTKTATTPPQQQQEAAVAGANEIETREKSWTLKLKKMIVSMSCSVNMRCC